MKHKKPTRINTISEALRFLGLPKPEHLLITVMDYSKLQTFDLDQKEMNVMLDFYYISLKRGCINKLFYGQQMLDFDEGVMMFVAPNQILRGAPSPDDDLSGWGVLIHPDFLWGTSLANKVKKYEYFDYSVSEALFLSDKEEVVLNGIIENVKNEYHATIDKFSQDIIISHLETLLNYAERFYQRQFITRKITNHQILDKLEKLLSDYLNSDDLIIRGLPTVQYISDNLNISQSYLLSLLKTLTGSTTQQYIHDKLIDKAKEKLSTTGLSVSEIAYELGFEHLQSFSKLFKTKTNLSPLEFRRLFN